MPIQHRKSKKQDLIVAVILNIFLRFYQVDNWVSLWVAEEIKYTGIATSSTPSNSCAHSFIAVKTPNYEGQILLSPAPKNGKYNEIERIRMPDLKKIRPERHWHSCS
jgi:hypothetical protein